MSARAWDRRRAKKRLNRVNIFSTPSRYVGRFYFMIAPDSWTLGSMKTLPHIPFDEEAPEHGAY
jgi:hypothetical protein